MLGLRTEAQRHATAGGLVETRYAVEDRRLAGAVGADDGGDLAAPGGERQIVDGNETAEAHGEMLDREQRGGRRDHQPWPSPTRSPRTARLCLRKMDGMRVEITPRGFQIITSTMASPKISMR